MNRLLNSKILNAVFKILIFIAAAKSISLILFIFLPKSGIEAHSNNNIINFNAYSASPFSHVSQNDAAANIQASQISSLKLLAVYKEERGTNAFAVISDGSSSEVLKTEDRYKQYIVGEIKSNGVFLKENDSSFWVALAESSIAIPPSVNIPMNNRVVGGGKMQANEGEYMNVLKRSEIDEFLANPDTVFKNIGFKDVVKDGKLEGFRVLSINRNSFFAKLGLRSGDIIQSFNGVKLDNYSSVLEIYNNAKSYSKVKLEVMRNNEKKEFEYEIY
ncbi:MAG: PDZ domain-containing protein [Campylobacteraceae bacterium]|jgi:type II secretion system protein C|nr:PDZ domain-containing protein [Campylobacteraceae bacterium]